MAAKNKEKQIGIATSTDKRLEDLYGLIEGIEVAMFTTRRRDGQLVSRAMQTQARDERVADLWFVTDVDSHKLDEMRADPHVNCSYYKDGTREWVSVSGVARITQDPEQIHALYKPNWKAWFGDEGGARDGGPDDPRIALLLVDVELATYLKVDKPKPVVLFEVVKGMVTGTRPDVGEQHTVSGTELDR